MEGDFQIEATGDGKLRLFVLWPGILTMDSQDAYDIAHVLIEEANKLRREKAFKIDFKDG